MHDAVAASISFFALGANLLAILLLLLFNPRNREVRWYCAFGFFICLWLLSQAMAYQSGSWGIWVWAEAVAVTMMPALFLATALIDLDRPAREAWAAVLAGCVVLFLIVALREGNWSLAMSVWSVIGWGGGAWLMSRSTVRQRTRAAGSSGIDRLVLTVLLVMAPLSVVVGVLFGSAGFFAYAMPIITIVIQLLLFVGITRMRFYDIEVRVARTGELAAQAAESERLAVLGELAATVAHEVRNPLTGVRSLAQRLAEENIDQEKRQRYSEIILEEVDRLDRMVNNLLGVSRRTTRMAWDGQPASLPMLFDDLTLLVSGSARARQVSIETSTGALQADAPREALAQTLLNLLMNAIRHAPEGSVIQLGSRAVADGVEIVVRDQGPGIPAAERESIFQPFHSGGNGTGLGLSVVRSVARDLGWRLQVADAPGGGAEFVIAVPSRVAAEV